MGHEIDLEVSEGVVGVDINLFGVADGEGDLLGADVVSDELTVAGVYYNTLLLLLLRGIYEKVCMYAKLKCRVQHFLGILIKSVLVNLQVLLNVMRPYHLE